jgi:hypothetical protein
MICQQQKNDFRLTIMVGFIIIPGTSILAVIGPLSGGLGKSLLLKVVHEWRKAWLAISSSGYARNQDYDIRPDRLWNWFCRFRGFPVFLPVPFQ